MSRRKGLGWAEKFSVHQVADGFWIKCTCYEANYSGPRRTRVHVASIAEVQQWTHDHSCEYLTYDSAMVACKRAATDRANEKGGAAIREFMERLAGLE